MSINLVDELGGYKWEKRENGWWKGGGSYVLKWEDTVEARRM